MTEITPGRIQNGYPGFAKLMGQDFNEGSGIFKQFAELNARNLLYMQAELLCLEQELDAITHMDENGNDPTTKNFARSVSEMRKASNSSQWDKILEIRKKLREYNDCLLQQARVSKLDRAQVYDSRWLRYWLQHEEGGRGFLEGCELRAYDELEQPDLIVVSNKSSNDKFTQWLELSLVPRLPVVLKKILASAVWLSGSVTTTINPTSQRTSSDGIFVMGAIAGLVIKSKDIEATSFNKCEVDFFACGMRDFEAGSVYPDDDPTDDPDLHPTGPVAHGSAA
ncbi:unnamed protein product [Alternaria alternata]